MKGPTACITVRNPTGVIERDDMGRPTTVYSERSLDAVIGNPHRSTQETAGDSAGYGVVDQIARVPLNVTANENTVIVIDGSCIPGADGTYAVVGVRPNRIDQRLMLRRRNT